MLAQEVGIGCLCGLSPWKEGVTGVGALPHLHSHGQRPRTKSSGKQKQLFSLDTEAFRSGIKFMLKIMNVEVLKRNSVGRLQRRSSLKTI